MTTINTKYPKEHVIIIKLQGLYDAKKSNALRARDTQRARGECESLEECRKIDAKLNKKIKQLEKTKHRLGIRGGNNDAPMNEMMFMIDPYGRERIQPTSPLQIGTDMYMLNPNKDINLLASYGDYMMFPKSNRPILRDHYDQKNKLRIYPHMFQQYAQLKDERKEVKYGQTQPKPGAVDYPIPMRFQLQYLQNRPTPGYNLDYDMLVKEESQEFPAFTGDATDPDYFHTAQIDDSLEDEARRIRQIELQKKQIRNIVEQQAIIDKSRRAQPPEPSIIQGEPTMKEEQIIEDQIRKVPRTNGMRRIQKVMQVEKEPKTIVMGRGPVSRRMSQVSVKFPDVLKVKLLTGTKEVSVKESVKQDKITEAKADLKEQKKEEIKEAKVEAAVEQNQEIEKEKRKKETERMMEKATTVPEKLQIKKDLDEKEEQVEKDNLKNKVDRNKANSIKTQIFRSLDKIARMEIQHMILKQIHLRGTAKNGKLSNKTIDKITKSQDKIMKRIDELREQNKGANERIKELLDKQPDVLENIRSEINEYEQKINKKIQEASIMPSGETGWFYTEKDYGGVKTVLKYGFHDVPNVGGVMDNQLSSFKIPSGSKVILYFDVGAAGKKRIYYGPRSVHILPGAWDDQVSGIKFIREKQATAVAPIVLPPPATNQPINYGDVVWVYNYYSSLGKGWLNMVTKNGNTVAVAGYVPKKWTIGGGTGPLKYGSVIRLINSEGTHLGLLGESAGTCSFRSSTTGSVKAWTISGQKVGNPVLDGPGMRLTSDRGVHYLQLCGGADDSGNMSVGVTKAANNHGFWRMYRAT